MFKEERNYAYFLKKYAQYLTPVVETYAYCLLKNHFHILIRVKSQEELRQFYKNSSVNISKAYDEGLHSPEFIVSKQFSRLFSSFTQAINKSVGRTGSLIETPFKRIEVDTENYVTHLIWYIHNNAKKHGIVRDFRDYAHSSYHSHLATNSTKLARKQVLAWFGGVDQYRKFHESQMEEEAIRGLIIE
jgi:REP element-mobilizing transposase RayT